VLHRLNHGGAIGRKQNPQTRFRCYVQVIVPPSRAEPGRAERQPAGSARKL
jgi:hypothetical protein